MGADAVEMDVCSTRNGVLGLMHDSDLARPACCKKETVFSLAGAAGGEFTYAKFLLPILLWPNYTMW